MILRILGNTQKIFEKIGIINCGWNIFNNFLNLNNAIAKKSKITSKRVHSFM